MQVVSDIVTKDNCLGSTLLLYNLQLFWNVLKIYTVYYLCIGVMHEVLLLGVFSCVLAFVN